MKRLGVLLSFLAASPARADLPPEALRLEAALDRVEALRAEVHQVRSIFLSGEEIESRGRLAFRRPHAFRLAFDTPDPQELVIAGDSLWVVLPEENQAQRYAYAPDAPGNEVFLLFGGGVGKLSDAFDVTQEPWLDHPAALLLRPKRTEEGNPIEEIRLVLGKDGLPARLFYREAGGDTVALRFTGFEKNPKDIEESLALRLPEGIEVIDGTPPRLHDGMGMDDDEEP